MIGLIIPSELRFLSPTIKLILILIEFMFFLKFIKKYKKKQSDIVLSLIFAIFFIIASTLFSSFDILLGWRDLIGTDSYIGMGLAFIMNAGANISYLWLIIEVFFAKDQWNQKQKAIYGGYAALELLLTITAMVLRTQGEDVFILMVIHMVLSMITYIIMTMKAINMRKRMRNSKFEERFKNLTWSGVSLTIMIVLFSIDSFFAEVTLYSIMGWSMMAVTLYFLYKGFI